MTNVKKFLNSCCLLMLLLATVSCHKDMFNEADYNELVEQAQPVKHIQASHTWQLTTTYYITVEPGTAFSGMKRLQILSANPARGQGADILGDYPLTGNAREYVAFTAPSVLTKFYAALVDETGTYTVTPFSADDRNVSFSQPTDIRAVVDEHKVGLQSFSYCFEDEMPKPGDYDYNDVVLRISQERTAADQITLNVTLAAVGSLAQVAAAIRLIGYDYDDIKSVTTVDDESFDKDVRKSAVPFIDSHEFLTRGINGEAVINLFEDAHVATGAYGYTSEGYIPRYKYNVSKTSGEDYDMVSPRTVSYVITFKNPVLLDYFTLATLDPFAIVEYNGILMEEHALFEYRTYTVLHDYSQPSSAVILPWALVVPTGAFRYPLDGVNIGFASDDALFGAYMTDGHSFGQWASNSAMARDWYNYPTGNMVY